MSKAIIKIKKLVVIIFLLVFLLKFFTAVLYHKEDPTTSIALKWNPFSENKIFQYNGEKGYHIMYSDENYCFGENLLYLLYGIPIGIYIIINIVMVYLVITRKKRK